MSAEVPWLQVSEQRREAVWRSSMQSTCGRCSQNQIQSRWNTLTVINITGVLGAHEDVLQQTAFSCSVTGSIICDVLLLTERLLNIYPLAVPSVLSMFACSMELDTIKRLHYGLVICYGRASATLLQDAATRLRPFLEQSCKYE